MKEANYYNKDFFQSVQVDALSSARHVIPFIADIIKPSSVVDIGCGRGSWLRVWNKEYNVPNILGIEGPYIPKELMEIPQEHVVLQDLKKPIEITRRFDLVMSLEVAEHLPESHAEEFVETLTGLGDVILFSAAIIGQEGTFHINEQMPDYWAKKFRRRGYVPVDFLRSKIWGKDDNIQWWYQQNILFYIKKERLGELPELQAYEVVDDRSLTRIHPWLYMYKQERLDKTKTFIGYLRWRLYPLKVFVRNKLKRKKG